MEKTLAVSALDLVFLSAWIYLHCTLMDAECNKFKFFFFKLNNQIQRKQDLEQRRNE